jgi:hypothetical protein
MELVSAKTALVIEAQLYCLPFFIAKAFEQHIVSREKIILKLDLIVFWFYISDL